MTDDVRDVTPCWKHQWLHTRDPFDAFAVWARARWDPLTIQQKRDVLHRAGCYGMPGSELRSCDDADAYWASIAYGADDAVPHHMKTPRVCLVPEEDQPF